MKRWWPLVGLAIAPFVLVLDQCVMNASISAPVADLDTTVTTIQALITLYCLVMATLMLTGAQVPHEQPPPHTKPALATV
jgi:predicted MFS family arabinose efflux permease